MKKTGNKIKKIASKRKKVVKKIVNAKVKMKAKIKVKVKAKAKIKAKKILLKPEILKPAKKAASKKPLLTKTKSSFGPADVKPYQTKKNEEYMAKKQLEHFRSVLLQWKEQLMTEVDRTVHHMQDESSNYPDPVDRASQEEEFNLELRARDRERKLLRKIEETLSRINDQDYGYCDDCGAEIGVRRLEARPTANQCIECKTISEIREKQIGDGN